jgi:putative N6-adenine-specific DNA methylase
MALPKSLACWTTCAPGTERLLAAELRGLGLVPGETEPGGMEFTASAPQLADAVMQLRTANRVAVRLATFEARAFGELERRAAKVPWEEVIKPGGLVHFRVTSTKSKLFHEDGIAERLERAVAAIVKGSSAIRGAAEAGKIDETDLRMKRIGRIQRITVRLMRDEVTISADAVGAGLHMRGYRQEVAKAPLRETLAAALLLASGWDPSQRLLDPFCGSGTIAIEAALMARGIAPGKLRRFAMEAWPAMNSNIMSDARKRATAMERKSNVSIAGSDRDAGAIAAAMANAERAGVAGDISFTQAALSALAADAGTGWIVTNPPYGERVGERNALRDLYATLGKMLRERRPQWNLAMLSADKMLEGQVGLELKEVLRTTNGGIPVRVVTA